jgi:DNA-binding transcriptional MerR regulator
MFSESSALTVGRVAAALTIDELAREAGMTVRNVRAYRSRGLIPPPVLRGRKGYYGRDHLARLELVRELKDKGFNLEAIAQLMERAPSDALDQVLDFTRAVVEPLAREEPEVVSARVFRERWGDQITPELARRAIQLGFIRRVGDDRWEIRSPRLDRASKELSEIGIPLAAAVEIAATLKRSTEATAQAYVDLFVEHVWEQAGDWPELRAKLARLQPLATESLLAVFGLTMAEAVEQALEERLAERAS